MRPSGCSAVYPGRHRPLHSRTRRSDAGGKQRAARPNSKRHCFIWGRPESSAKSFRTRHGFHIVAVDQRIPGKMLSLETVREQIAEQLKASVEERRQYVSILAGQAEIIGVDLPRAQTPLVLQ